MSSSCFPSFRNVFDKFLKIVHCTKILRVWIRCLNLIICCCYSEGQFQIESLFCWMHPRVRFYISCNKIKNVLHFQFLFVSSSYRDVNSCQCFPIDLSLIIICENWSRTYGYHHQFSWLCILFLFQCARMTVTKCSSSIDKAMENKFAYIWFHHQFSYSISFVLNLSLLTIHIKIEKYFCTHSIQFAIFKVY